MVLHSLALRDVATLWVKIMFILDRSEGLTVLAGVSSSVHCHLSVFFSRVDTGHVFPLLYFKNTKNLFIHIAHYPVRRFLRDIPTF